MQGFIIPGFNNERSRKNLWFLKAVLPIVSIQAPPDVLQDWPLEDELKHDIKGFLSQANLRVMSLEDCKENPSGSSLLFDVQILGENEPYTLYVSLAVYQTVMPLTHMGLIERPATAITWAAGAHVATGCTLESLRSPIGLWILVADGVLSEFTIAFEQAKNRQ